ncbi:helix-turn-helix domain-containing protein [Kitasatospora fiedleri]|uniref:helix-turn-helix domain-containing protein n=1 Tax=Kitasatospora fiedleri TaxID=2991545 RepID=UPI00249CF2E6|nr:helix-turn-helix domain-containing protein [Kitasatospora fiedleri]
MAANIPRRQEDYDDVRRLHAQGFGRNEIADQIGRSRHLVSMLAAEMGLAFARAGEVEVAMETRRAQLADRRLTLAEQLQTDAENLRAQLWQPATVFAFGGKDNTYEEHTLDEPPAADKKNLMATAGMALDRSLKLVPPVESSGIEEAGTMLGNLMLGLKRVHDQVKADAAGSGEAVDDAAGDADPDRA